MAHCTVSYTGRCPILGAVLSCLVCYEPFTVRLHDTTSTPRVLYMFAPWVFRDVDSLSMPTPSASVLGTPV